MLDEADRLAVALGILRRRGPVDVEAVTAVLLEHWSTIDVARAVSRGLGALCTAEGACAIAADVDGARRDEARQALLEADLGDLLDRDNQRRQLD